MSKSTTISIQLADFETLQKAGKVSSDFCPGVLFCQVAADTRAAATTPASQEAFRFLIIGIHEDENSANLFIDSRQRFLPWLDNSKEVWSAILQPFHHKGEANYLNKLNPGTLFNSLVESPGPNAPIVSLTTSGWNTGDDLEMSRVQEFSNGVLAVRASMTAVEGLHSQQSFFFPGVLTYDPISITLWQNAVSLGKFAYGPGIHNSQMERQRMQNLADRTSFTRCKILRSEGTWHGTNPAN